MTRVTRYYIGGKEVKKEEFFKASAEPTDFEYMKNTLEKIGIKFKHVETDPYQIIFINSNCMAFYFDKNNNEKYLTSTILNTLDLHTGK